MNMNINIECAVILTAAGADEINKYFADLAKWSCYKHKIYHEGEIYKTQLWDLMNIFGKMMYIGNNNLPFADNNIIFGDKEIAELLAKSVKKAFNVKD